MNDYIYREDSIFGTKVSHKIYKENIDCELILDKSTSIMKEFENKLSLFKETSEISKINENAGNDFVYVSKDTFDIIDKSIYFSKLTQGLLDITIAPLVKAWGINTYNPRFIEKENIDKILPLINYNDIILDEKNLGVRLAKKNQKIDLGGIAKGYIADYIIDFYKKNNVKSAILNIGGNIKVLGRKDNKNKWNVGIYEPIKHSTTAICSVNVSDMSVVTSGIYERAFIQNDKLYHHILNPNTGYPAVTDIKSITIINESSLICDALSTPLLIMGVNKASEFIKNNNINGIIIDDKNNIILTKNLIKDFTLFENYKVLCF